MDMGRALEILGALADGLDPSTGEPAARDSILQHPDTIRALHLVLTVLEPGEGKPAVRKANSYNPWSSEEDAKLCKEFLGNMDFAEIANIHGRSRGAITSRLARLGKLPPTGRDREAA
jgi:hypothetical protein